MLVLGIETSCDETAVAIVKDGQMILSNVISSSLHLHKRYGGVVPEIATRSHVELINLVLARALKRAKVKLGQIDLVACVYGPGLVGALLIGISLAKVLSLSLNLPLIGVNHLQAHLYAPLIFRGKSGSAPQFPFVGLVVSGGHTTLFYIKDYLDWKLLGATRDDAAGEAFDKVAKILRLGYPGGPAIERQAKEADPDKVKFPRSYLKEDNLDFSFSGLKTAVLYYIRNHESGVTSHESRNIAAGFQEAVVDILTKKALQACLLKRAQTLVVGGGVTRNRRLRKVLGGRLSRLGINVYFPQSALCQDNAVMVAGLGYQLYRRGVVSDLNLEPEPNLLSK